jgi:hypothetical protein
MIYNQVITTAFAVIPRRFTKVAVLKKNSQGHNACQIAGENKKLLLTR